MAKGKLQHGYPILTGLFALLVLGIIFYFQFTSDTKESSAVSYFERLEVSKQKETSEMLGENGTAHKEADESANIQNEAARANKSFIPFELNYSTKDAFDRFIFARTTEDPQTVKFAYTTYVSTVFTPTTQAVASDLFSRYVDYKLALSSIETEVDLATHSLQDVSYKLDEREGIRRTYFNDTEYHYLFSQEAQVDEAALERLRIAQENTLPREERKALIVAAIKTGNEAEREAFQPTLNMHRINEIKRSYSDINDRYNAMAAEFGSAVADRFAKTWEKQGQWESKIADFQTFRESLSQQALSPSEAEDAQREYLSARFTNNEIKRLKVITSL
ncbi:MAG: lipase chaperone [Pseudomonadota bacterium]|nr:lipase chaperone [Pseudomonadota bacterium]